MRHTRRNFIKASVIAGAAFGVTSAWRAIFANGATRPSPYGPLGEPNRDGLRLPAKFSARRVATTNVLVPGTDYIWHGWPDGAACFARAQGGWVYVSNSELLDQKGGVGVLSFSSSGEIDGAYKILSGTNTNCAGGATPWNTWLSCEEAPGGLVWECDPFAPGQGVARPAMGQFVHEAAAVDPRTGFVYLTEDETDSRLYRFRPEQPRVLTNGVLEAASVTPAGRVTWKTVSANEPHRSADAAVFNRGEGAWFDADTLYFCTTGDHCVWALNTQTDQLEVIYDAAAYGASAPLHEPDNVTVHPTSGDIFVAEDDGALQLVLLADNAGEKIAAPFMQFIGHDSSEVSGPAFSPDGRRLYLSSQRGRDGEHGMTFEITGPFRS
jgi:uncharacterized protein